LQKLFYGLNGDSGGFVLRKTINPCTYVGESNAVATVFNRKRKTFSITGSQGFFFPVISASPHRAYGVNNIPGGKFKTSGYSGLSGRASVKPAAGVEQLRTGGPVYGAIHTATPQQAAVGCIDNGICLNGGDVGKNAADFIHFTKAFRLFLQSAGHFHILPPLPYHLFQ
jgi:hypothetical protein